MQTGEFFGWALAHLRSDEGNRVRRAGWNGKGMFLFYMPGYPDGVPANANTAKSMGIAEGVIVRVPPYIMMRTADGALVPWLASQTDLLSDDWELC